MTQPIESSLSPEEFALRLAESQAVRDRVRAIRPPTAPAPAQPKLLADTPSGPRPVGEIVGHLRAIEAAAMRLLNSLPYAIPHSLAELPTLATDHPARQLARGIVAVRETARCMADDLAARNP